MSQIKKYLIVIAMCLITIGLNAQLKISGNYQLLVDLSKIKEKPVQVFLRYIDESSGKMTVKLDSGTVVSGKVSFNGILVEPSEATLNFNAVVARNRRSRNSYSFYLEPGRLKILVKDSLSNAELIGAKYEKSYRELTNNNRAANLKLEELNAVFSKTPDRESVAFRKTAEVYSSIFDQWIYTDTKNFIIKNANSSPVSVLALRLYTGFDIKNPQQADSLYKLLNPVFLKMTNIKSIKKKIDAALSASIGKPAPLFAETDNSGKSVSLASFKGKYVLLDFWASWCVPCREENPNLISNFNRYNAKGFTILSVSLDREDGRKAWLDAIQKDGIGMWTHVSSLQSFNNKVAKLYGVTGIPQNFLIDPNGKVIAINLKGKELTKKLDEIFTK